jgi:urease accessory protein
MPGWLLLQLADSAFPTGGFAHSAGLEAAVQLGEVVTEQHLESFLRDLLWQLGLGALPFVAASHESPGSLVRHDALADAFLTGRPANRASRVQGRTFIATSARVFSCDGLAPLAEAARSGAVRAHYAPLFGAALRVLGLSCDEAQRLFLHTGLRGVVSAAIRLGVVGPHRAQSIQHLLAPALDQVFDACSKRSLDDLAQPAPLLELLGGAHDGLYSRLFQS